MFRSRPIFDLLLRAVVGRRTYTRPKRKLFFEEFESRQVLSTIWAWAGSELSGNACGASECLGAPEGNPGIAWIDSSPANGTFSINYDPDNLQAAYDQGLPFTYLPNDGFTGTDSFDYFVNGPYFYGSGTATIYVGSAVDHDFSTEENTALEMDLLDGAVNPAGGIWLQTVTSPQHGTVTGDSSTSATYVPENGYHGIDSFQYTAEANWFDESESVHVEFATAAVTVAIGPTPTANDDNYIFTPDTELSIGGNGVLGNDDDADSGSAMLISGPSHGSVGLNSDGSFSYMPDAGSTEDDSFSYQINVNGLTSGVATVNLSTNSPPNAADDLYRSHGGTIQIGQSSGVLANDSDPDGDALTAVLITEPINGTLTLNADGSFTYAPGSGFSTDGDYFVYAADDGRAQSTATVMLSPLNGPPNLADHEYSTHADTQLSADAPGLLSGASDPDGDALNASVATDPSHGSVTVSPNGSFVYEPDAGYQGVDQFTYKATDLFGAFSTATVVIAVDNTAPVATNTALPPNTFETPGNHTHTDAIWIDTPTTVDVVANGAATDPDGDTIIAVRIVNEPLIGTVSISGTAITYTPNGSRIGEDSFTYQVFDGVAWSNSATISTGLIIPHAYDDEYSVVKNQTLNINTILAGLLGNDKAKQGYSAGPIGQYPDGLTINADGTFTFTAGPSAGDIIFVYTLYDHSGDGHGFGNIFDAATVVIHVLDS